MFKINQLWPGSGPEMSPGKADPVGHQEDSIGHLNGVGHDHGSIGYANGLGHQKFHGDAPADEGPDGGGEPYADGGPSPVGHQEESTGHLNGVGHDHGSVGYANGEGHAKFHGGGEGDGYGGEEGSGDGAAGEGDGEIAGDVGELDEFCDAIFCLPPLDESADDAGPEDEWVFEEIG